MSSIGVFEGFQESKLVIATSLMTNTSELITPYGGKLINLLTAEEERQELKEYATRLPSIQLSARAICDLELLAVGAFSPLDRFMGQRDFQSVLDTMRLAGGHLFPIPVTLPVEPGPDIRLGQDIALRDDKNNLLATLTQQAVEKMVIVSAPVGAEGELEIDEFSVRPLKKETR